MKQFLSISTLSSLTALALLSPAMAEQEKQASKNGYYLGGSFNLNMYQDTDLSVNGAYAGDVEFGSDFGFGLQLGKKFNHNLRAEADLSYNQVDGDYSVTGVNVGSADVENIALMGNGYYDFNNRSNFTPYIGLGIGFSHVKGSLNIPGFGSDSETDTVFAYNLMTGVNYALSDKITTGLEYRFFDTSTPDLGGVELDNQSHNIGFKLAYHF